MATPRTPRKAPRAADAPIAVPIEQEAMGVLISMRGALLHQLATIDRILVRRRGGELQKGDIVTVRSQ